MPFLAAYREFCSPEEFFDLLRTRYEVPPPAFQSDDNMKEWTELSVYVAEKSLKMLQVWIANFR